MPDEAEKLVRQWKESDETVVFTNGCFDILHIGHVDYLEKARQLGSKLIVAVNTDQSIQSIKGPSRPIVNEESRLRVIAALECVDLVIPFPDETPKNIISVILPDILVKGNDYLAECTDPNDPRFIVGSNLVRANGGRVETIELVEGYSTTNIIDKIKKGG